MRTISFAAVLLLSWVASGELAAGPAAGPAAGGPGEVHASLSSISRVSYADDESQANDFCTLAVASDDSVHHVAWESSATNLVSGDTNGVSDVFVRDTVLGTTVRASVGPGGVQANGASRASSISGDGRYIAFESDATNLVAGDTNGGTDVFVHDRQTGVTSRVSVSSSGAQATGGSSFGASISPQGNEVIFQSYSPTLVAGDTTSSFADLFIRNLTTGTTTRILGTGGVQPNGASFDGTIQPGTIAFRSFATNLVGGDTNGKPDVFLLDRGAGTLVRVNVTPGGGQSAPVADSLSDPPRVSGDGRYVVFRSDAADLVAGDTNGAGDLFVRDRQTAITTRVSTGSAGEQANAASRYANISSTGQYVVFATSATNLASGAGGVMMKNRVSGAVTRIDVTSAGGNPGSNGHSAVLTRDDGWIVFISFASDLVAGDTNGKTDVFVRPRP